MKNTILFLVFFTVALVCDAQKKTTIAPWVPYNETEELAANANHPSPKMRYKLIQSQVLDKNEIWKSVEKQIRNFSEVEYQKLKPYIFEQNIPALQSYIKSGVLTYEKLTKWYLYRIVKYENDRNKALNVIISINPNAVNEARKKDKQKSAKDHPIFGIPILLKDNIGFQGMPTTAGAQVLKDNFTANAFIVDRIKEKGGIILGKTTLSEWANYLCLDCPNGYSAVGGQTLNSYGRKKFDTGGSSSGSGSAMAANYAAAAVGTETSGSILSPSSKNSVVGLKPTVGLLSRSGIVPLSSTLDTPGPMTRNVTDNAILLSAMSGEDETDPVTKNNPKNISYWQLLPNVSLEGLRFGVFKPYLEDSIYKLTVAKIKSAGGVMIEIEPAQLKFDDFGNLLTADMKMDLPNYLKKYASQKVTSRTIQDIINHNKQDSLVRIPYGQGRFEGMPSFNISQEELIQLRKRLHDEGAGFFDKPMSDFKLDVILSIDNRNAGYAAAAHYPCLTVPMGYRPSGEPCSLTFIARPFEEDKLLKMGFAFEQLTKTRKSPGEYQ